MPKILKPLLIFIFAFNFFLPLYGNPWGKDADLVSVKKASFSSNSSCPTPFLGTFAESMIAFHQQIISPADGPRSHFIPSSSQYTLDGMRKYGFFKGFFLGCDRLMRENDDPWIYPTVYDLNGKLMKWDPVK